MEAIDGYRRAALLLRELSTDEQAWMLGQLEDDDRLRIGQLLETMRDSAADVKDAAAESSEKARVETDAEVIEDAPFHVLASVLTEQPDWVAALVLAYSKKSGAMHLFVNRLSPDRTEQFRLLIKQVRDEIKPKVREVVLRAVAGRIRSNTAKQAETRDFESILGQVASR